jgi:hypothetical protein
MRLVILCLLPVLLVTTAFAQSSKSANQYALIINGNTYNSGSKIPINDLKMLWKIAGNMQVQFPSGKKITPVVFEWVIKKDTDVWKFHTYSADTFAAPDPETATPGSTDASKGPMPFASQLYSMHGSDILYFDEFQFADKPKDFPRSFKFSVK